ncbi:MAG: aminoglycoside phosphotransferase family protein, partial [Tabrizicola sp.]|nr:aminoglycoside phosphotransferase family protein [Tabrizicola sp.]
LASRAPVPGPSACRDSLLRRMPLARPEAAIHGDVHAGNLLRLGDGRLALIDWEEARLGPVAQDLGYGPGAEARASHAAAEVSACWRAEPGRARAMARRLRMIGM